MSTTQPNSFQSIQVCAMRVTRLSSAGTPLTGVGTTNGYIAKAPVMVKLIPQYETGVELKIMTGCGTLGAYYKAPDQLKNYNLDFELTDLDNELIEILTDEPIVSSGGLTVGHTAKRVAACSAATRNGVAVEFWSKKWSSCSVPAGAQQYWHWFMPWAFLQTGEIDLQNDFAHVPITGFLQESTNFAQGGWTSGNWPDPTGLKSVWGVTSDSFFPTAASGYQAVV